MDSRPCAIHLAHSGEQSPWSSKLNAQMLVSLTGGHALLPESPLPKE